MSSSSRSPFALDPAAGQNSPVMGSWADGFATLTNGGASDPLFPVRRPRAKGILAASDPLTLRHSEGAEPPPAWGSNGSAWASGSLIPGSTPKGSNRDVQLQANLPEFVPAPLRFGPCTCPACTGGARLVGAVAPSGSTTVAAPAAAVSLGTLADYLTTGFWQEWGDTPYHFNLTNSGTGAKNGTLTYNVSGWADDSNGLTLDRRVLARQVMQNYAAATGINFVEVTGAGGDIRFTDNQAGAYAYMASGWYADAARTSIIADYTVVNVETAWYDGQSNYDTYVPQTFNHEVGHAMGLGHAGSYNYQGVPLTYANSAQFANDSWQATQMSYWDQAENPTTGASFAWLHTPMAVDWMAMDDLYAAQGFGTGNAFNGDTIYGVGTNISASVSKMWNEFSRYGGSGAFTLVDGSGYDTLDVSNYNANQLINLAPSQRASTAPSRSNIGGKIGNLCIAAGTIIEAAVGGSGSDGFYGNDVANTFWGGGGNDGFYDSLGSDTYYGDAGSDTLYFAESLNLFSYALDANALRFSRLAGGNDVDLVSYSVETIDFNGTAYSYGQLVAGLGSSALPSVIIQTVNGSLVSGAVTNATALSFLGTISQALDVNQEIAVYRDGVRIGTATPTVSGGTTWAFETTEAAGTTSVVYTARVVVNGSADVGVFSSPFQLTVDTVAPLVGVNSLQTFDTTPLLSGTVDDPNAQVSVQIGASTHAATNNGNGTWTLQWNDVLAAGATYDVMATATDAVGNSGKDSTTGELILGVDDFSASSGTTGLVVVGGSSGGVLESLGDHDWFGIDLQQGRTYELSLNGTTLADPYLRLYSSGGVVLASNDDIQNGVQLNSRITYTPTSSTRFYLDAGAYNEAFTGGYTVAARDVTPAPTLYFSLANSVTTSSVAVMGGITARNNDIISFNGYSFNVWLNGNNSGLAGAQLRDFYIINPDEVVVAFQSAVTLSGISFTTSDLAKLTRTGGSFALSKYFEGADVGLSGTTEAIDAITGLADGRLVLSTRGAGSVLSGTSNLSFAAEDLLAFAPTTLGTTTTGVWSLYADMSDVSLSTSTRDFNENVNALDITATGRMVMSTQGNASASRLSATNEDVFGFLPTRLGSTTSGAFQSPLAFDGSVFGLAPNDLVGIDVPG